MKLTDAADAMLPEEAKLALKRVTALDMAHKSSTLRCPGSPVASISEQEAPSPQIAGERAPAPPTLPGSQAADSVPEAGTSTGTEANRSTQAYAEDVVTYPKPSPQANLTTAVGPGKPIGFPKSGL